MNTGTTWQIGSTNSDATELIGASLGKRFKGGEVIELISDLGGGKTTLVRGIVRGMGSQDHVASPTFTISRVYHSDKLTLHHFDFYRLPSAGIIRQELTEILDDPSNVVVIEWAGIVQDALPDSRLKIQIKPTGDDTRQLTFDYPPNLAYLIDPEIKVG